jgi:hypothetical protein
MGTSLENEMKNKLALTLLMLVLASSLWLTSSQAGMNSMVQTSPANTADYPSPLETPEACGNGEKVVGRILNLNPQEGTLALEVHRLSVIAGEPDQVDTITVVVTSETHLMRDRKSMPLKDLYVFTIGTAIGVMGGVVRNSRMQARCIGEDVVRMTPVKRLPGKTGSLPKYP